MILKPARNIFFIFSAMVIAMCWGNRAKAWDLRVGYHQSHPRITTRSETFKSASGSLIFEPTLSEMLTGQEVSIGVGFDSYVISLIQSRYGFRTLIPASNDAVTEDTRADVVFEETRLEGTYHLEREIAGFFGGGGISSVTEKVTSGAGNWKREVYAPYIKLGIDIIFQGFRIRYHQLYSANGGQELRTNTLGVMMIF